MASKIVVMLVACYTVAMLVHTMRAEIKLVEYGKCFADCHNNCQKNGNAKEFCNGKCDSDCMARMSTSNDAIHKVQDFSTARGRASGAGLVNTQPQMGAATQNAPRINRKRK
ncbi:hypothetical protein SAY87_010029 [Trapa incisa]|uniref:Uncharacterized protein n=1 Tax=Trapa incisa TaxID=236973 RepID=A0AAN7GPX7_9MYRT|nr:hypothetical protein SAY87_010029 [Trapa incisa]